jgi:hypothetical protein
MTTEGLQAMTAIPLYEPKRRLERRPQRGEVVQGDSGADATTPGERFRVRTALLLLWGGLAAVIVAYGIARGSVSALVLGVLVACMMRAPSTAAFSPDVCDDGWSGGPIGFTR